MLYKIRILITHVSMSFGGVETQLIELLNGISKYGYQIDLVLCEKKGELINQIPRNVEITELRAKLHKGLNIKLIYGLMNIIRVRRPDIVISFHSATNFESLIATKIVSNEIPVVAHLPGKIHKGRLDCLRKLLYPKFNYIIAIF